MVYPDGTTASYTYDLTHEYDALNRLTHTTGLWGYKEHTYSYDSLGNLVYEKNDSGAKKGNEYWYNNLNQQVKKQVDGKDNYAYTYDKRGNLVKGVYLIERRSIWRREFFHQPKRSDKCTYHFINIRRYNHDADLYSKAVSHRK